MTLDEYIASPASYQPTFVVDGDTSLATWANATAGNDYERVLVTANAALASKGVNLTAAETKQIAFINDAQLTFTNTPNDLYYTANPNSSEYWIYKPKISNSGSFTGAMYSMDRLCNIHEPNITLAPTANGSGGYAGGRGGGNTSYSGVGGSGGALLYFLRDSSNIANAQITATANGGNGVAGWNGAGGGGGGSGGTIYGFSGSRHIHNAVITATANGGNGGVTSNGGNGGNGGNGKIYTFDNAYDIVDAQITAIASGSSSGTAGENHTGSGSGSGGGGGGGNTSVGGGGGYNPSGAANGGAGGAGIVALYAFHQCALVSGTITASANLTKFAPDVSPRFLTIDAPRRNQPHNVSWQFEALSTGSILYKNAILQASYDNGATYTTIYQGAATTYTNTIPANATSVMYRLYAFDGTTNLDTCQLPTEVYAVIISEPMIVGDEGDLGTFDQSFAPYAYSLAKDAEDTEEWNEAAVEERLNGTLIRNLTMAVGDEATII
jgi:hypothetical protein